MRFETSQSTPPHLNRRLQLRMLSFVAMFAVVMFLVNIVLTDTPKPKPDSTDRSAVPRRKIDYNIHEDDRRPLKPDEIIITPPDRFQAPLERSREWLDEQAARGEEWAEDAAARDRESARRSTRFDRRLLANVKDNTLGIRRDETQAYYRLLDHAKHASPADLERAAVAEVQYINLMTEPDRFRGEPITIQGDLWRLYEFEAGPNDRGLTTLYEAWIFTGDSGTHPYRVVSTSLPHTLTPGENIRKPVRVTGYFFKREGYPSQGGMHVAPTLIAPTLTPYRPANAIPPTDTIVPYMMGVVTAVGLALLVTLLAFAIGERRVKRIARQRMLNEPAPSFAGLDAGPVITVEEALQQFAEQQRQAELRDEIAATGQTAGKVANTVLYRRDPQAHVPPPIPVAPLTDDELQSRHVAQANVLQNWTTRQNAHERDAADDTTNGEQQRDREARETQRVLNSLSPETDDDTQNEDPDAATYSLSTAASNRAATASVPKNPRPETALKSSTATAADPEQGASKLAEWEREIQQLSDRPHTDTTSGDKQPTRDRSDVAPTSPDH